jgi:hypothetical protein
VKHRQPHVITTYQTETNRMITVFERIPDLFVQLYDGAFQMWAREFRARGNRCAVPFARRPGAPVLLDAEGREIVAGAWLEAEHMADGRMVIRPASERDEELIARHVREMRPHVLQ